MENYKENGKVFEITLENGKIVKVGSEWVYKTMKNLETDLEDVLLMWLEDNDYLVNEEQDELDKTAKGKVKIINKSEKATKKTQKERVQKENPKKEFIIKEIANFLQNLPITNVNIENKAKIITFDYEKESFKIDLIQKRKAKGEK